MMGHKFSFPFFPRIILNTELSTDVGGDFPSNTLSIATAGDDFVELIYLQLTFAIDEDEKDVCIQLEDDKYFEIEDTLRLEIANADGLEDINDPYEQKNQAFIIIRNNDGKEKNTSELTNEMAL